MSLYDQELFDGWGYVLPCGCVEGLRRLDGGLAIWTAVEACATHSLDHGHHTEQEDVPTRCSTCDGDGWYIEAQHDPSCDGDCDSCPIAVQVQCEVCRGTGVPVNEGRP